jgi:hypothetical protein
MEKAYKSLQEYEDDNPLFLVFAKPKDIWDVAFKAGSASTNEDVQCLKDTVDYLISVISEHAELIKSNVKPIKINDGFSITWDEYVQLRDAAARAEVYRENLLLERGRQSGCKEIKAYIQNDLKGR